MFNFRDDHLRDADNKPGNVRRRFRGDVGRLNKWVKLSDPLYKWVTASDLAVNVEFIDMIIELYFEWNRDGDESSAV